MQEINSNNTISLEHKFPETRAMRSGKQEWLSLKWWIYECVKSSRELGATEDLKYNVEQINLKINQKAIIWVCAFTCIRINKTVCNYS